MNLKDAGNVYFTIKSPSGESKRAVKLINKALDNYREATERHYMLALKKALPAQIERITQESKEELHIKGEFFSGVEILFVETSVVVEAYMDKSRLRRTQ